MTALELFVTFGVTVEAILLVSRFARWAMHRRTRAASQPRPRDIALGVSCAVICALVWSVSFVSLSYVSRTVDAFDVNVIMLGVASVFLLLAYLVAEGVNRVLGRTAAEQDEVKVNWGTLTPWIATLGNVGNFTLFVYALYFISASQAITLGETSPVFVALLTWLWLGRPLPATTIAATGLSVLAALLIMGEGDLRIAVDSATTQGSILAISGGAAFALFSTGLEKIAPKPLKLSNTLSFMGTGFAIACGTVLGVAYLRHRIPATIDWFSWVILIVNGVRVAGVYVLFSIAVRRIGALLTAIIVSLEVPFTMIWDARFLHRDVLPKLLIGAGAILLAAFTLATDRWRAIRSQPPSAGDSANQAETVDAQSAGKT